MVRELAQTLHVAPSVLYTVALAGLLIAALVVGFILNRVLHHWTKKLRNTWGELVFALLESLPMPLLVLAALYTGLELLTLPNNHVIVPKSTLAKAVITNYSLPEPRMAYVLPVSVAYGTDPQRVEKVLLDVAQEAIRDGVEGLLAEPAPFVRLIRGFGDSSLDFALIVQVRQFTDQYLVQGELRKRILRRFEQEAIQMSFPTRTLVPDESTRKLLGGTEPKP
jgi:hypothetical protein